MATDSEKAAQLLRGYDQRISQLEQEQEPDAPANIIEGVSDVSQMVDVVSTAVIEVSPSSWDDTVTADWDDTMTWG